MPDSAKPALQDSPRVVTPRRDATRPAATIQRGEAVAGSHITRSRPKFPHRVFRPGSDQGRQGSGSSESSPPLRGPHQLRMLRTAAVAAVRAYDGVASVAPLHAVVCVRPGIRACVRACVRSISVPAACDPVAVLLSSSRTV